MKNNFKIVLALTLMSSTALANSATVKGNGTSGKRAAKATSAKASPRVTNIPLLKIKTENVVTPKDIAPMRLPSSQALTLSPVKKRVSPATISFSLKDYQAQVGAPKIVASPDGFKNIPDVKYLSDFPVTKPTQPVVNLVEIKDMKPNDYKLLQALIFLEIQQKYEMAMGLFAELIEDPVHKTEALYHYALTAKGLQLNSEFREYMLKVAKESKDKDWQMRAAKALVDNVSILENNDIALIEPLVEKFDLDVTRNDDFQIARAKFHSEKGNLGQMEDALIFITDKSPKYPEALLLNALFNYRHNKIEEATSYLEKMMKATEKDKTSTLRSVGALTMARIQFQKGLYKDAFKSYLLVDKSNPLWLQAMVESAWTQILGEDFEGAAGNMFSLHTDFFKNAFSPESYVVRTVGYLNLCQYGDGVQVLTELKKRYSPWQAKLNDYKKSHKKNTDYYETVKNWVKNSDFKEVDGLPRSFIVELARHPSFMNLQSQINAYEDEMSKYNNVAMTLINIERELHKKQTQANSELMEVQGKIKTRTPSSTESDRIASAEQKLMSYKIQLHIAKKARNSIKNLRTTGITRIEKEKESLRLQAANALKNRFNALSGELDKVLGQTEVLQYEIYAGAGEHIRYQMAGGEISDKERPELKVEKEKSLNWKFKGEIWEDEVGHYRSSLKNVCSQDNAIAGLNN